MHEALPPQLPLFLINHGDMIQIKLRHGTIKKYRNTEVWNSMKINKELLPPQGELFLSSSSDFPILPCYIDCHY